MPAQAPEVEDPEGHHGRGQRPIGQVDREAGGGQHRGRAGGEAVPTGDGRRSPRSPARRRARWRPGRRPARRGPDHHGPVHAVGPGPHVAPQARRCRTAARRRSARAARLVDAAPSPATRRQEALDLGAVVGVGVLVAPGPGGDHSSSGDIGGGLGAGAQRAGPRSGDDLGQEAAHALGGRRRPRAPRRGRAARPTGRRPGWSPATGPAPRARGGGRRWSPTRSTCRRGRRRAAGACGSRPGSRSAARAARRRHALGQGRVDRGPAPAAGRVRLGQVDEADGHRGRLGAATASRPVRLRWSAISTGWPTASPRGCRRRRW